MHDLMKNIRKYNFNLKKSAINNAKILKVDTNGKIQY